MSEQTKPKFRHRFRGFLPVVIDVETAGFNAETDALLEVAAVFLEMDQQGLLKPGDSVHHHIKPFEGAILVKEALEFTGIIPDHPFRFAVSEYQGLSELFQQVKQAVKKAGCQRAVLVGHNAWFDLSFIKAATARTALKKMPFHGFTSLDTATLSALMFGQTVLAKAAEMAGINFDQQQAHSALYDAQKTAELFCYIVNHWQHQAGWPFLDESHPKS